MDERSTLSPLLNCPETIVPVKTVPLPLMLKQWSIIAISSELTLSRLIPLKLIMTDSINLSIFF